MKKNNDSENHHGKVDKDADQEIVIDKSITFEDDWVIIGIDEDIPTPTTLE